MPWPTWAPFANPAWGSPSPGRDYRTMYLSQPVLPLGASLATNRFFRWSGVSAGAPVAALAGWGVAIDGVTMSWWNENPTILGWLALRGHVVLVEAGAAFAAGADLMSDSVGRAVTQTTGNAIVARALEGASGMGSLALVVIQ